ncbi:hypothetical protein Tco_1320161 [Tanacetum coccineum]
MIKDRQFDGRARVDPHKHIAEFVEICGMFRYGTTNVDSIKLKLFLSSLSGDAKVWYNELSPGTIIQIFYHGLDDATQAILDAGGIFLYKAPNEAYQLLDDQLLLKLDWSKDIKAKPLRKNINFAKGSDNSKLMKKMKALTTKIDSQFKDIKEEMKEMRDGPTGSLPSNTQTNPKPSGSNDQPYRPPPARNEHVNDVFIRSGKTYDLRVNLNNKPTIIHDDSDDEADEAKKEEPSSFKPNKSDQPPLKAYKPKIPFPQRLHKEKMQEHYAKFIDMIKEFRINVPLVDVLAGMPNYGKLLKDLVSNKNKMEQIYDAFLNEEYALLNDSEPFLSTLEKINETSLDKEFKEFMAIDVEEIPEIKTSIQELPNDLEMKPLPKHLEYDFLEKESLLLIIIFALFEADEKKRLVSVLKNHKDVFA